ncbi:hypothetical protein [Nonlabens marinus]|uniref:Uncharacterized protein n=1 Tax=Nonlabens marinus S1-08 TaxID=1454201 RepID=W8VXN8_9FLAO|nr:hypothetical protein [Nonlabens marinus]BAO56252.1 hypothetical protein NMS_2243 [Nonlabens marinus S1-08]
MADYTINQEAAVKMKLHYQQEYSQTVKKLAEIKSILDQLKDVDTGVIEDYTPEQTVTVSPQNDRGRDTAAPKRKYKKKPGRKSIWGKFILSRLKSTRVPLSYDDMANHAIAIKNLEPTDFEKIRKKIIAAAFVLRSKQDKIDNYAIKGSRTKYMGLKEWFEREGLLKDEFRNKIITK